MAIFNKILPHRVVDAIGLTYPIHMILAENAVMEAPKFRFVTTALFGMPHQPYAYYYYYYKPCEVYAVEGRNTYVIRKL